MNTRPVEKVLRGWLRRKGGRLKIWSRRWCILTDKFLFIFLRDDDSKFQDCLTLNEQIIAEPPLDPADPQHGAYFDIITEHDDGHSETQSFCAETEEDKKIWVRALNRALYADKGGALFSQSLEEILYWEHMAGRQIPYLVNQCVEFLYKHGLDMEGIFRLPGRQTRVKDIIARFERGHKINFENEGTDVHVVASVLKAFLRTLPDSIIPCKFFQKFMNIALSFTNEREEASRQVLIQELAEAMKLLPRDNYTILKYICRFLREVGRHESTNKMSFESLGTVFGYNILRHIDAENSQLFLLTADIAQNLIYMLLKYYTQVFLLEYKSEEDKRSMKRRKGLLRMSQTIDIPTPFPIISVTSSDLTDHEDSDLTTGLTTWSQTESCAQTSKADNHLLSAENFRLKIECDDGPADENIVSMRVNRTLTDVKRSLHLSLSDYDLEVAGLTEDAKSTYSYSSSSESSTSVSPRRANTRLVRNRYLSDRRRPESVTLGVGERLSRDLHSPGGVNSEDVFLALALVNSSSQNPTSTSAFANTSVRFDDAFTECPISTSAVSEVSASFDDAFAQNSVFTPAPSKTLASCDDVFTSASSISTNLIANSSQCPILSSPPSSTFARLDKVKYFTNSTYKCSSAPNSKTVTDSVITQERNHKTYPTISEQTLSKSLLLEANAEIGSNITDLEIQISALKEQLTQHRNSHRVHVATLQAQLSDMKESYERKIEMVQREHMSRKVELENKLAEIKQYHALAVAESASLEESFNKYKLMCGDLP